MRNQYKISSGILLILLLTIIPVLLLGQEDAPTPTKYFELENGLRVFLYEKHTVPLIHSVFAFNVGSKDEDDSTNGLVHILEHYILFRGTKFRSGEEVSQDTRRHGAYFNAHTGRDLSLFEMTLPAEHLDFALANQKEILFDLEFDQQALDEEKQIILEEINQVKDDPFKYATTLLYQNIFPEHPYQRPIYGREEIIQNATIDQLDEFYRKYFVPDNCVLAAVGDFKIEEMEEKIKLSLGELQSSGFAAQEFKKATPLEKTIEIEKQMDVNTAYLAIATPAPDYSDDDQYAMDLLAECLGRGLNPMLNYPLMRNRITNSSLRMGYSSHLYGGTTAIFVALEPKSLKRAKNELIRYLKQARQENYSKTDFSGDERFYAIDFLESAKNRVLLRGEKAQENGLNIAVSMARYMQMTKNTEQKNYLDNIAKTSSSDLRKVAGKYLSRKAYMIVYIVPKKDKKP